MAEKVGLQNATSCDIAQISALENPLDFFAEDHMREREVCALIDKIVSGGVVEDVELQQMLAFLEEQLPHHLADEEIDLFPMMLDRCEPDDEIEKAIEKLLSDHGHAIADAPAIAALIRGHAAVSEYSDDDRSKLVEFAHHARRHLILENAIILPIARTRLTQSDLSVMKAHMLERRGHADPEESKAC